MDITWIQVLTIVGANLAMIMAMVGSTIALYVHSNRESKAEYARLDAKLEEWRRESNSMISSFHKEMSEFRNELKSFHDEMKSFHGRLCTVETKQPIKKIDK